ncbi:hypothetical protein VTJ04DRAFT_747 [Mycothermus thermophilus]|uniref:uncharacterized protein n=1 Tax=Humicola insolens TaxID=85995 RepID=UPI00374218FA
MYVLYIPPSPASIYEFSPGKPYHLITQPPILLSIPITRDKAGKQEREREKEENKGIIMTTSHSIYLRGCLIGTFPPLFHPPLRRAGQAGGPKEKHKRIFPSSPRCETAAKKS